MKNFTLIVLFAFVSIAAKAQDTIPNPGFEYWSYIPVPGYWNTTNWTNFNYLTSNYLDICTAFPDSTVVHSGKYSIKLITKSISGNLAPGIVTTGVVQGDTTIVGGIPIHSRPLSLNGWYQYAPKNHDSASMLITLTKWSAAGDSEIVIGAGTLYSNDSTTSWMQFSVPVTYYSDSLPDTVLLQFYSSGGLSQQINSTLWLDDLSYSYYPLGIKGVENKVISVYPNPAENQFSIDNQNIHATLLNLYSVDGKLVKGYNLHDGINTLDASGVSAGMYLIKATDNTGATYTNSLVIEK